MAKAPHLSLSFDLFSEIEDEPTVEQIEANGKEHREATERSRALREDLVFPPTETSLLPLGRSTVRIPDGASHIVPIGESAWWSCDECRRDQELRRIADDFTDPTSWEFMMGVVAHGDVPGHAKAADTFALGRLEELNPHALAFVAQARHHGLTDPALEPVRVSEAGRREFDLAELARYANELLRGVRSLAPQMTPERWGEAIAKVREIGAAQ